MKFNFLNDERINSRYNTVIKNIRSESNSFYDSFLDLVETTIRYILNEEKIKTLKYTIGEILNDEEINEKLFSLLDYKTSSLLDFIRKCNKHKHEKEKEISLETVLNFMNEYLTLVNKYLAYKEEVTINISINCFTQIYGQTKRDNVNLNKKVKELIDELKESYLENKLSKENMIQMKKLLEEKEVDLDNLEENNELLKRKIDELKDIKISSMENKLNKTIELLLDLKEEIALNKALSKAVGHSIMGENFDDFIDEELGEKNGK